MVKLFAKFGEALKSQDLFGIPVQLGYKGQNAFNTVSGGIVTLIFLIVFAIAFSYQLFELAFRPQFLNYPPRSDYSETKVNI